MKKIIAALAAAAALSGLTTGCQGYWPPADCYPTCSTPIPGFPPAP